MTPSLNIREAIAVRVLLVSRNAQAIQCLRQQMQRLSMRVEVCCDTDSAIARLCRSKSEGVVIDVNLGDNAIELLKKIRALTSHRHAISFAIVDRPDEISAAFHAHANFVLPRPLANPVVLRTLRAAYPMMFQERRRGYRHAVRLPVVTRPSSGAEVCTRSLNISETGICITADPGLQVGRQLSMQVDLPGLLGSVDVSGEVCWADASGKAGIRFGDLSSAGAENLKYWLSERMIEGLRQR